MFLNISQHLHSKCCIQIWTNVNTLVVRKQSNRFLWHSTGAWSLDQFRCVFSSSDSAVAHFTWPTMQSIQYRNATSIGALEPSPRSFPSFLGIGLSILPCVMQLPRRSTFSTLNTIHIPHKIRISKLKCFFFWFFFFWKSKEISLNKIYKSISNSFRAVSSYKIEDRLKPGRAMHG